MRQDRPVARLPGGAGDRAVILTLAAVAALGSMAIHMLVPALPIVAHDLRVSEAATQQLISIYLIGLAGGQIVAGPLADRFGRRPVMLTGLACYAIGAMGGALATGLPLLLGARLAQACGGAAGLVTARVMVGDRYGVKDATSRQATLMAIVTISPTVAPLIGGVLTDFFDWRAVPLLLALLAGMILLAAHQMLPETKAGQSGAKTVTNVRLLTAYKRLAGNRRFVLSTAAMASSASNMYIFLAAAPFLLVNQAGLSPTATGATLFLVAGAIIVGTRLLGLVQRHADAVLVGTTSAAAGAAISLALSLGGVHGPVALLAPVTVIAIGAGLISPAAINEVAFAEPGLAATATSLAGAIQMAASSLATVLLAMFAASDATRMDMALLASAGTGLSCALLRRGAPSVAIA